MATKNGETQNPLNSLTVHDNTNQITEYNSNHHNSLRAKSNVLIKVAKGSTEDSVVGYRKSQKQSSQSSVREVYPQLTRTWHPKKNEKTTKDVKASSSLVYWWKCPKGPDHEWPETISSRLKKGIDWCPCCLNYQVSKTNSLEGIAPHIAAQWHPSLNDPTIQPHLILATSAVAMWWKCPVADDHVWQASVESRVNNFKASNDHIIMRKVAATSVGATASSLSSLSNQIKIGDCPCCQDLKVSVTNSLATKRPQIAELWHPNKNMVDGMKLTPCDVLASSSGSCWLKCHPSSRGHPILFQSLAHVKLYNDDSVLSATQLQQVQPSINVSISASSSEVFHHNSPFICKKCAEISVREALDFVLFKVGTQILNIETKNETETNTIDTKKNKKVLSSASLLSLARLKAKTKPPPLISPTLSSNPLSAPFTPSTAQTSLVSNQKINEEGDDTAISGNKANSTSKRVVNQNTTEKEKEEKNKKSSTCAIS